MKIKALLASIMILTLAIGIGGNARHASAAAIVKAANQFLAALTAEQRAKALMEFNDEERFNWFYVPRARRGITLKELDESQRKLAQEFLKATLSQRGYYKATTIMELELVLREMEGAAHRDPTLYYFSFFGQPADKGQWGWRIEGHHLSLNFTAIDGRVVATTPSFLGSNPAEVRQGPRRGLRVLGAEEDIARELLHSFNEQQRAKDAPQSAICHRIERCKHSDAQRPPKEADAHSQNVQQRSRTLRIRRDLKDRIAPTTDIGKHLVFAQVGEGHGTIDGW